MIDKDVDFNKCNGCGACVNVCPKGCISMVPNSEEFLYPKINYSNCIKCNLCSRNCPVLFDTSKLISTHNLICFSGYYNSENILKSSSGGMGQAFYRYFINKNGVCYGVKYDEDFLTAKYFRFTDLEDINYSIGSKYIQAEKGNIFKSVISDLKNGEKVLFIGTPCDVAALKVLTKDNGNKLITIELICHGVTSSLVQKKYLEDNNKDNKKITGFSVRYKKNKWLPKYLKCDFANKKSLVENFDNSDYGIAFSKFSRLSCHNCKFKGDNKVADITIGDFWGVNKSSKIYNEKGTSVVFVHTKKGAEFLSEIPDLSLSEIPLTYGKKGNPYIYESHEISKERYVFSSNLQKTTLKKAIKKSFSFRFRNKKYIPKIFKNFYKKLKKSIKGENRFN